MRKLISILTTTFICLSLGMTAVSAKKKELPQTTTDGLERVTRPASGADAVYLADGADLSGYKKIVLLEPQISFMKGWKSHQNSQRHMANRLSDKDVQRMIEDGKDLFMDEFTDELEKKGYPVVHTKGEDVMIVRPLIVNLDVAYADPDNLGGMWNKVYTDGAGEATLIVELYDSVSGQILARAVDRKDDSGDSFSWRVPRSQSQNIADARRGISSWAKMLAKGLDRAKEEAK